MDCIANFDRAADHYEALGATQAALAGALAGWIAPSERHGAAIEFGAGTGMLTRHLLPWDGAYLATDAAPRMAALGRVRAPGATWAQRYASDTTCLRMMDWVFACNLLQWLEEPEGVLRAWRAIMAPGGHLAGVILLRGTLEELQALLPESSPVPWRTESEWRAMLNRTGFRLERAEVREQVVIYPTALDFLRTIHAMGLAPKPAVGPGRLRSVLREYDRSFASGRGVRATWRGWLARAVAV